MYYIELATGLRRGELLRLKWSDIDWKNGIIKVRRQIARVDGQIIERDITRKRRNEQHNDRQPGPASGVLKLHIVQLNGLAGGQEIINKLVYRPFEAADILRIIDQIAKLHAIHCDCHIGIGLRLCAQGI